MQPPAMRIVAPVPLPPGEKAPRRGVGIGRFPPVVLPRGMLATPRPASVRRQRVRIRVAVASNLTTSWDLIHSAAGGDAAARRQFAERYESVARGYLAQRWRGAACVGDLEDAVQEVFLDCLRSDGALQRADQARGEFRGFLFGVVRTVALRFEHARGQQLARGLPVGSAVDHLVGDETAASQAFDREWARSMLRIAMQLHRQRAEQDGEEQLRRVELLRLRFEAGMPIRDIAAQWQCDPAWLHHEFARARRDFKRSLGLALGLELTVTQDRLDHEVRRLWEALR